LGRGKARSHYHATGGQPSSGPGCAEDVARRYGRRQGREERYVIEPGERIRDVRQDSDGSIYLLTDTPQGRIVRLEPVAG